MTSKEIHDLKSKIIRSRDRAYRHQVPWSEVEKAADAYIEAIKQYAAETKRKLPIPRRTHILRAF